MNYVEIAKNLNSLNIGHPIWKRTLELSFAKLTLAAPGQVLVCIGPPRVGKSRLSLMLRKQINSPEIHINDANSLSIGVRASNCNTDGTFSTKAFARKALVALKHPIIANTTEDDLKQINKKETESSFWLALERGLPASGKRYMFVDETQNILRAAGRDTPGAILDAWKCFAEDTEIVLVLTGTYQLLYALQQATHVLGRKSFVHFPRYQISTEDVIGFQGIIDVYAKNLPLAKDVENLRKYSEYLYTGCLGCIGILERWLRDALAYAMVSNSQITLAMIEKARPSDSDLRHISSEIIDGEKSLIASGFKEQNLKVSKPTKQLSTELSNTNNQTSSKGKNKPFQVKPVRRKIGERVTGEVDV